MSSPEEGITSNLRAKVDSSFVRILQEVCRLCLAAKAAAACRPYAYVCCDSRFSAFPRSPYRLS
jgi:hypothetical protein